MGSEQSQHQSGSAASYTNARDARSRLSNTKLQRGNTIAVSGQSSRIEDNSQITHHDGRPTSPPLSVCSDSDLPYISYTDKPIGGTILLYFNFYTNIQINRMLFIIDSPKYRNKSQSSTRHVQTNVHELAKKSAAAKKRQISHDIVVVRSATKEVGIEKDADIQRIQVSKLKYIICLLDYFLG